MADTVKIPGIGKPLPKTAVLAGVGVTVVAILVYYRKQKTSAASSSSAGADQTGLASGGLGPDVTAGGAFPWDGTYGNPSDPYSMDTGTGQTFGNEGGGGFFTSGGGGGGGQAGGPPFSDNQEWSAYALQQLTQNSGQSPETVAEALGLYLDGKALDVKQQDIIYAAQAVAGQVPVSGSGGYPPRIRVKSTRTGGKGGKTFAVNPVTGVSVRPGIRSVTISWDKAEHATGYQVSLRNVTRHRTAHAPVTTALTRFTFDGLTAGDSFEATILAKPAEKGARPATIQAAPIAEMPGTKTAARR